MEARYIVRFIKYRMADQHKTQLQHHLDSWGSDDWQWIARRNAAAKFPTDFALLELNPQSQEAIKVSL